MLSTMYSVGNRSHQSENYGLPLYTNNKNGLTKMPLEKISVALYKNEKKKNLINKTMCTTHSNNGVQNKVTMNTKEPRTGTGSTQFVVCYLPKEAGTLR